MKKRKYTKRSHPPAVTVATAIVAPVDPPSAHLLLQDIREKATHERFRISQTVAELNALRDEIDATLAFLRAQK